MSHALLLHVFGGLVCLKMCLLLFRVVLFASAQSLALKHPQVYYTLLRFPMHFEGVVNGFRH